MLKDKIRNFKELKEVKNVCFKLIHESHCRLQNYFGSGSVTRQSGTDGTALTN